MKLMKLKIKKIAMVCLMILSMMLLTLSPVFAVGEEGCSHQYAYQDEWWVYDYREGGPCVEERWDIKTLGYRCLACHEWLWTVSTTWYFRGTIGEHDLYQTSAIMVCWNIDCDYWEWAKK